jgi:hypothetical protein
VCGLAWRFSHSSMISESLEDTITLLMCCCAVVTVIALVPGNIKSKLQADWTIYQRAAARGSRLFLADGRPFMTRQTYGKWRGVFF